jgi:hypothetical protein
MFIRKFSLAVLISVLSLAAHAETDPRDYAGITPLPSRTSLFLGYYRHQSSSDTTSITQDIAIFRGVYLLKFGNLTIVPIDFLIPVADVSVYLPIPDQGGVSSALHTSGIGDLTYLPTAIYEIPEGGGNSSLIGASLYVTAPVGSYDDTKLINVGNHRWTVKPEIAFGQRFASRYTFELIGNVTFYGDNTDFNVPGVPTKLTLSQSATPGLEAHFMADITDVLEMGASYYIFGNGRSSISESDTTVAGESTVNTVRGTVGIRIEKRSIIYLQYNQDLHASGGGTVSRFWGARVTHAF